MTNLKFQLLLTLFIIGINISYSQTWVQQSSGTSLNLNSVNFLDVNTGFIGVDSGRVLKTTNSGANWITTFTGFNFNIISIKFFNPNNGVATGDKIIKTTNGGLNWSVVLYSAYATDICFLNDNIWFISTILPRTNKMTTDQGVSWQIFSSANLIHMSVYFVDLNTGWISGKMPEAGGFVSQHIYSTVN